MRETNKGSKFGDREKVLLLAAEKRKKLSAFWEERTKKIISQGIYLKRFLFRTVSEKRFLF